jgi:hypothetical protein
MNRAARRHVESPALRLTRYYCRHGLEQPAAAMRHLLLVVRTRNQRMDFSRPDRYGVTWIVGADAAHTRLTVPPVGWPLASPTPPARGQAPA